MALARRRFRSSEDEGTWPGFVDALATLLLAIIFLLAVFVLAQFFLTQALTGRDQELDRLGAAIAGLEEMLAFERRENAQLRASITELTNVLSASTLEQEVLDQKLVALQARALTAEQDLAQLRNQSAAERSRAETQYRELETLYFENQDRLAEAEKRLAAAGERTGELESALKQERDAVAKGVEALTREQNLSREAQRQIYLLRRQIATLQLQLGEIQQLLDDYDRRDKESQAKIADLGRRLNRALASEVQKLARYRSEFFGRLREVLKGQAGIRIVGDRFVFQSEVLFASGSATLEPAGRLQLAKLATTLRKVAKDIPEDIDWVLRIDGHTDIRPIRTDRFPSNWELSSARAIAVAKFLSREGIPEQRLAPTGFASFHPLDEGESGASLSRNRRIELKLTQR